MIYLIAPVCYIADVARKGVLTQYGSILPIQYSSQSKARIEKSENFPWMLKSGEKNYVLEYFHEFMVLHQQCNATLMQPDRRGESPR